MTQDKKPLTRSELEIQIKKKAAFFIVAFAALLAFNAQVGGSNSSKIMQDTIAANNAWTHYGSKKIDAKLHNIMADILQAEGTDAKVKLSMVYRSEAQRLRDEPGDGMVALMATARALEADRERRGQYSPYFTYAGLALQIGIVLSTAAILAVFMPLFYGSVFVGTVGTVLFAIGYLGV